MRRALVPLLLLLALGCDDEPEVDPCARNLGALRERLERVAAMAEPAGAPDWVEPPEHASGVPFTEVGPLLVVTPDEVELAGRGVGGGDDPERMAENFSSDLRGWARSHRVDEDAPLWVAVWAAPDTTLGHLRDLVRLAPPQARYALLVRAPEPEARAEVPGWVDEAFAPTTPPGRPRVRQQHVERAWRRATRTCEGARPHLPLGGRLEATGPALGPPSVAPLMRALEECGCEGTELDVIEAVASRALVPPRGAVLRLPPALRFGPAMDDAPEQTFGPDDTVASLVERLGGSGGAVWVRVD